MAEQSLEVLRVGWASKEGGLVRNWKRRFFVLRSRLAEDHLPTWAAGATHVLLYYKSPDDGHAGAAPTGAVPIIPGKTVADEYSRGNRRCVRVRNMDARTYYFAAEGSGGEDGTENRDWIEALRALRPPPNAAELRRTTFSSRPGAITEVSLVGNLF